MRAAGGTSVPLMFDWLMWLSMPKVNAEWEKPENKTPFTFIKRESAERKMNTNTTQIFKEKSCLIQTKLTVIEYKNRMA